MIQSRKIVIVKPQQKLTGKYDQITLNNLVGQIADIQFYLQKLKNHLSRDSRITISHSPQFWEPILSVLAFLGFKNKMRYQNWIDSSDINNLLKLSGFEVVSEQKGFFGFKTVARMTNLKIVSVDKYSVSIIIPARNEQGNISKIVPSIPTFGKSQEIIFIEGNSTDKTWNEIEKIKGVLKLKQSGRGKKDAVLLGLSRAKGKILMIYDADRTVDAFELKKFYDALVNGIGDFANGSRMIYPMEVQAMRTLNKIGNKIFSIMFSWILGQKFKDTLCGTKAFFKSDYKNFKFTNNDPFGDFDLIFSAVRNNLKVIEVPVRYKERQYGKTNIHRFRNGLTLLRMTLLAFFEFKFSWRQNTQ